MAAAIGLGDSTRSRRALAAEQLQTARLIREEHAYRAEQRIQAERVRMARDLHDLLGHSLSIISLHTDVAREALGEGEEEARQALTQIRATTSETLRELRNTVKLLRNPATEQLDRGSASLANVATLVESARTSGLAVDLHRQGDLANLPATVDTAAYRIVQESLTNVLRHAHASLVTISIRHLGNRLELQITDNGVARAEHAPTATNATGSGLAGMSERARLLGGALVARPRVSGGFEVLASLPIQDRP
jgi:signal transduction histidine kinase